MWAQVCNVLLGVWLLVAPDVLHFHGAPDTIARVTGPVIIAVAVLSIRDVTRIARFGNILPAVWLLLAPWFLHYPAGVPLANEELVGMAIAIFAVIPVGVHQRTGGGWLSLLRFTPASTPTGMSRD